MGEKTINFWKIIKGTKRQSIRMQQRLIVYWCEVILTVFLVTVLLLSILGVLPGMDFKVRDVYKRQVFPVFLCLQRNIYKRKNIKKQISFWIKFQIL